ncbi:MFS transporter [Caniella muris]|uniref:MFS transporter n=1 Tax=Caniella muris TaxID=2941502 RepID=UPI00203AADA5|nr:MFS transporter [Caniella muris]
MLPSVSHVLALPRLQNAATQQEPILTRSFALGFVASFALRANLFVLSVVMCAYCMDRYGADVASASAACGIFTIGCLAARFLGGPVTDRLGLRATTLVGLGLTCASSLLYLAAGTLDAILAIRLVHGLCYGVASTTVTSIASADLPERRHGEGMGYFMLSVTLASAVGPLLGMVLSAGPASDLLFMVAAGLAAVAMAATALTGPLPADKAREATALEDVDSLEPGAPSVDFDPAGVRLLATPRPLARFLECSALPVGAVAFVGYLIYGAVSTYLDPFASQAGLMGAASVFFVVYALTMLATRPMTAKLLDTRGPAPLLVPGFVAMGAGIVVMGMAANGAALLVAAALIGYGMGAIQPTGLAMATQHLDRSRYTVANATFYMMGDLACGVAPVIFGLIVPMVGYRGLFCGLVLVAAAGVALFEGLHRKQLV